MNARRVLLAALALALTSAACQPPAQEAAGLSAEDVAAIRQMHDHLFEAVVAGDWSVLDAYGEDGVAMPPDNPAIKGLAAIKAYNMALPIEFVGGGGTPDVIDGRDGLAYVRGNFYYDMRIEGQPDVVRYDGKLLWLLEKQPDGAWRLNTAIWNSNLPLPESGM